MAACSRQVARARSKVRPFSSSRPVEQPRRSGGLKWPCAHPGRCRCCRAATQADEEQEREGDGSLAHSTASHAAPGHEQPDSELARIAQAAHSQATVLCLLDARGAHVLWSNRDLAHLALHAHPHPNFMAELLLDLPRAAALVHGRDGSDAELLRQVLDAVHATGTWCGNVSSPLADALLRLPPRDATHAHRLHAWASLPPLAGVAHVAPPPTGTDDCALTSVYEDSGCSSGSGFAGEGGVEQQRASAPAATQQQRQQRLGLGLGHTLYEDEDGADQPAEEGRRAASHDAAGGLLRPLTRPAAAHTAPQHSLAPAAWEAPSTSCSAPPRGDDAAAAARARTPVPLPAPDDEQPVLPLPTLGNVTTLAADSPERGGNGAPLPQTQPLKVKWADEHSGDHGRLLSLCGGSPTAEAADAAPGAGRRLVRANSSSSARRPRAHRQWSEVSCPGHSESEQACWVAAHEQGNAERCPSAGGDGAWRSAGRSTSCPVVGLQQPQRTACERPSAVRSAAGRGAAKRSKSFVAVHWGDGQPAPQAASAAEPSSPSRAQAPRRLLVQRTSGADAADGGVPGRASGAASARTSASSAAHRRRLSRRSVSFAYGHQHGHLVPPAAAHSAQLPSGAARHGSLIAAHRPVRTHSGASLAPGDAAPCASPMAAVLPRLQNLGPRTSTMLQSMGWDHLIAAAPASGDPPVHSAASDTMQLISNKSSLGLDVSSAGALAALPPAADAAAHAISSPHLSAGQQPQQHVCGGGGGGSAGPVRLGEQLSRSAHARLSKAPAPCADGGWDDAAAEACPPRTSLAKRLTGECDGSSHVPCDGRTREPRESALPCLRRALQGALRACSGRRTSARPRAWPRPTSPTAGAAASAPRPALESLQRQARRVAAAWSCRGNPRGARPWAGRRAWGSTASALAPRCGRCRPRTLRTQRAR